MPTTAVERVASPAGASTLRKIDYTLDDLTLDGRGTRADVVLGDSILDAWLELTIEGASTIEIEVEDPELKLLRSDTLAEWVWGEGDRGEKTWVRAGRDVDARLDDYPYRLVRVGKDERRLTLTLEDRAVAWLREMKGARKASRARMTRAQFAHLLVKEVRRGGGIDLFAPEKDVRQPIARERDRRRERERDEDGAPGLDRDAHLTVKGVRATPEQRRLIERVLDVCDSHGAGERPTLAALVACIGEAGFNRRARNPRSGALGLYQLLPSTARSFNLDPLDVEACTAQFLTHGFTAGPRGNRGAIPLARAHPDWTVGQLVSRVEGSDADGGFYQRHLAEAQEMLAAYEGGGGEVSSTRRARYEFARGRNENTWDCLGRLAEEVAWRRFMRGGRLWFVSDDYLFRQRAALTMREREDGCDTLDFDLDLGARQPIAEVRARVRADRWDVLPGMVVKVEGAGPADGRWLVSTVRVNLLDRSGFAEVTLRKPVPKKPEPAAERIERDRENAPGAGDGDGAAEAIYAECLRISEAGPPYVYGGGHGPPLSSLRSGQGLDCSSSSSLALFRAGAFRGNVAQVSGWFAQHYGRRGRGQFVTVWANAEHMFIEFNIPGKRATRFDTSPHGSGGSGARMRYTERSTAGFTPRHWPGT